MKKKQGSITLETLPTVTTNQITNSKLTFSHQMTNLHDNKVIKNKQIKIQIKLNKLNKNDTNLTTNIHNFMLIIVLFICF